MDLTELCEVGQISRSLYFYLTCLFLIHPSPQYYKPSSFTSTTFEFPKDTLEQRACTVCLALKNMQENTQVMLFFSSAHLTKCSRKWQPTPVFLPEKAHGQKPGALCSLGLHRVWQDWEHIKTSNSQTDLKIVSVFSDRISCGWNWRANPFSKWSLCLLYRLLPVSSSPLRTVLSSFSPFMFWNLFPVTWNKDFYLVLALGGLVH